MAIGQTPHGDVQPQARELELADVRRRGDRFRLGPVQYRSVRASSSRRSATNRLLAIRRGRDAAWRASELSWILHNIHYAKYAIRQLRLLLAFWLSSTHSLMATPGSNAAPS